MCRCTGIIIVVKSVYCGMRGGLLILEVKVYSNSQYIRLKRLFNLATIPGLKAHKMFT